MLAGQQGLPRLQASLRLQHQKGVWLAWQAVGLSGAAQGSWGVLGRSAAEGAAEGCWLSPPPCTLLSSFAHCRDGYFDWKDGLWRILNVVMGVAISTLASMVIFPVRARWLLQRDTASLLIKLGELGVS